MDDQQLNAQASENARKLCPHCGLQVASDSAFCAHCGYHMLGASAARRGPIMERTLVLCYVSLFLSALAFLFAVHVLLSHRQPQHYAAAAPMGQVTDATLSTKSEFMSAQEPASAVSSDERAPVHEQEESMRTSLETSLERRFPLHQPGDRVSLVHRNGMVTRGQLIVVRGREAQIVDEDRIIRVDLGELEDESRMRTDTAFRQQHVERRLQQLLNERQVQANR